MHMTHLMPTPTTAAHAFADTCLPTSSPAVARS